MRLIYRSGAALATILLAGPAFAVSREDNLNDPIVDEENAVLADAPNVPPLILRFAIHGWTGPTALVCQLRRELLGQVCI